MKHYIYTLLLLSALQSALHAQIIYTIAGNGTAGFSGDGGAANLAAIGEPYKVALDNVGNLYIADVSDFRVRKVSTTGIISTFAGNGIDTYSGDGGAATDAGIEQPLGVAVDNAGNVYIATPDRIRMVNTAGSISTFAGGGSTFAENVPAATAKISTAFDVATDRSGNVYYVELNKNRVRKVNASGIVNTIAGTGGAGYNGDGIQATMAQLNNPYGIAIDRAGNVFIADGENNRIRKVNTAGVISTVAGNGYGAALSASLTGGFSGDGGLADSAEIYSPYGVSVDDSGNIYIADTYNNRVRKVDDSGIITTLSGNGTAGYSGDGIAATMAELNGPSGVTTDNWGYVYIADAGNSRIRRIGAPLGLVSERLPAKFAVYPNPVTCTLQICYPETIMSLTIDNIIGKQMFAQEYNSSNISVNVSDLAQGVYIIKINGNAARTFLKE